MGREVWPGNQRWQGVVSEFSQRARWRHDAVLNFMETAQTLAPQLLSSSPPMMTFAYQARDSGGKMVSGVQEAINEDNAINTLMTRGLMVLSIQQKAGAKAAAPKGKVSETDLVLFTRQLATMVDAGLPLVAGLTALYEQADPKKQAGLRRVVGEVTALVQQGDSFCEAISKHPRIFARLYVAMV